MDFETFDRYTCFGAIVDDPIVRCPEREAIIFGDWRVTYGQFGRMIRQTAHCLQRLDVRKGDRVAIISRNCPECLIAEFALYKIGAIAVKINWRLTPDEMAYILDLNGVTCVFYKPEKPEWGQELKARYAGQIQFIDFDAEEQTLSMRHRIADMPDDPVCADVRREDEACRLHTSGTTGHPKCVVYTHGAMLDELRSALGVYSYPDGQRYQYIAQLFHAAAIGAHLSLATGGSMVLMPQFSIATYMHSLVAEKINAISVVPAILKWILDEMDKQHYDLSNLRTINYSTCPIPPALLQRAIEKLDCNFYQSYGMTEMGSIVTLLAPEDHFSDGGVHRDSVGRPIAGAAVRIVDENGRECAPGEPGEIYVKGPGRMKEYFGQPELTAACFADGWYKTKDVGYLDQDGYLTLCGRKDDLIISGGENIYPGEVYNVIMRLCDDVAEAAVYGVPDETWGEHVKASIVRMPGSRLTPEALIQYCKDNMPHFRVPKEIEFVDALPKNATGKVVISKLKNRAKVSA